MFISHRLCMFRNEARLSTEGGGGGEGWWGAKVLRKKILKFQTSIFSVNKQ